VKAEIIERPDTFDRVDRIKVALGQKVQSGDDRFWILGSPLLVEIDGVVHTVPTGFTTDGASIPKPGQWLTGWDPWEPPQKWAAIVHDWLYCAPNVAKKYADRAFRAVLQAEGSNWWQVNVMYAAVALFGGPAYLTDQVAGPRIHT
jgi:hypothetical protein